ncbi:MAG TPA: DUF1566 domain-containing protein [Victivallales bacterium]|nr:DUF1566 domain-containing protein [Victivallales bacterium]
MSKRTLLILNLTLLIILNSFIDIYAQKKDAKILLTYPLVDTGQVKCYNNYRKIPYPESGSSFYGQDAEYVSNTPKYKDNSNGTVTDLNTGLMWSKTVEKNKVSLIEAERIAERMTLGGYSDWRVPSIKELYSLIDFSGYTGFTGRQFHNNAPSNAIPFINTDYFDFAYGNTNNGERYIDAQWLTNTKYVSKTMGGADTLFGVNFADGRIKGYGYQRRGMRREKKFYVRYVRGNISYGKNHFLNNKNGTITDKATGLMWMQNDSGKSMKWQQSLAYADNLKYAGYNDWRLPNAKELQSIVDYTRSPDATDSAAISSLFNITSIKNEAGKKDYPCFWTSTTHLDGPNPGRSAAYITFGRAIGKMHGKIMDVHGAGAQRSDPKTGSKTFRGPQGDAIRVYNYVRCVRGGSVKHRTKEPYVNKNKYPNKITLEQNHYFSNSSSKLKSNLNPGRNNFVSRLDKNGDNRVSKNEFDGPKNRFSHHDTNNDGYITENEAPTGPPPGKEESGGRN